MKRNVSAGVDQYSVGIKCACSGVIVLQRKHTGCKPWLISNWTKHFKTCSAKKSTRAQTSLSSFLSPLNSVNQDPEHGSNSCASIVSVDQHKCVSPITVSNSVNQDPEHGSNSCALIVSVDQHKCASPITVTGNDTAVDDHTIDWDLSVSPTAPPMATISEIVPTNDDNGQNFQ